MKKKGKIHKICLITVFLAAVAVAAANLTVSRYARHSFDHLDTAPPVYCAILLGTSKYVRGGRRNLYYLYRIQAAKELYAGGGCKKIIVSGDNGTMQYNEPVTMKKDLIKAGVPGEDIICDYAGFRTLDSIIRFKLVFGQKKGVVVSQKFHNARAIYIGRSYGIELYGYNAQDVGVRSGFRTRLREVLSKVMCVLDVEVLRTEPKYLGKQIRV